MHVIEPMELTLHAAQNTLTVKWEDNHVSVYGVRYLRGYCPCAHCQGHHAGWHFIPQEHEPQVESIAEVGNYALNIRYKGGHYTGIYSFDILRKLCPCDECQQQQGEQHPMKRMPS